MLIGFIGDVHGRVFHALAVVARWQQEHGKRLDLVIQVGDLGAYPDPRRVDEATAWFAREDPSELDFSRMLRASGKLADSLHKIRRQFLSPIHFIRGNHDDHAWLKQLVRDSGSTTVPADPFDLYRYVADGAVLQISDVKIGFLGGAGYEGEGESAIDEQAYGALLGCRPMEIDVLVTHDAPYGVAVYQGQIQGSRKVSELIEGLQPEYLIAGHYHHVNGPRRYGRTTYLGLDILVVRHASCAG